MHHTNIKILTLGENVNVRNAELKRHVKFPSLR